jgi:hypothetical protein
MVRYQDRPDYVADQAWSRGYLKPMEVLRVAASKTGQGLAPLTLNTEASFEERTGAAIDCIRAWRGRNVIGIDDDAFWADWRETARRAIGAKVAKTGLLGLDGVGYPMASAILDILDPEVWPVIDRWAVRAVFGTQPTGAPWPVSRWHRAATYQAYARHLATRGASCWGQDLSMHKLDQRAMTMSRNHERPPKSWVLAKLPQ